MTKYPGCSKKGFGPDDGTATAVGGFAGESAMGDLGIEGLEEIGCEVGFAFVERVASEGGGREEGGWSGRTEDDRLGGGEEFSGRGGGDGRCEMG